MKIWRPLLLSLCLCSAGAWAQDAPDAREAQRSENDPAFYLELIAGMQQKGLWFASMAHLEVFEQRWPDDRRALLLRADALRRTGDPAQASAIYRRLLEHGPSAAAHRGLGLIAAAAGDLRQAGEALALAARLAPIEVSILNDLGYVQLLIGRRAEARLSLHKAAELAPDNARVGANLALYYLLEGNAAQAERIMAGHAFPEAQRESIRQEARQFGRSNGAGADWLDRVGDDATREIAK